MTGEKNMAPPIFPSVVEEVVTSSDDDDSASDDASDDGLRGGALTLHPAVAHVIGGDPLAPPPGPPLPAVVRVTEYPSCASLIDYRHLAC